MLSWTIACFDAALVQYAQQSKPKMRHLPHQSTAAHLNVGRNSEKDGLPLRSESIQEYGAMQGTIPGSLEPEGCSEETDKTRSSGVQTN